MNNFFECNLPRIAPDHLHYSIIPAFEAAVENIYKRTDALNQALAISGMKPETFQLLASDLFKREEKQYGNTAHFDAMSPETLANYCKTVFVEDVKEDRLTFDNAVVLFDTAFATVKEWEYLRHIGIGGSDAAVIEGTSKFVTKQGLYHNKVGTPVLVNVNEDKSSVFERGHFLEDDVIGRFCAITGASRIRDTRMFRSKQFPHCIADIDAMLRMPSGEIVLFEAKTTVLENMDAWANEKVPAYYVTQTRHYPGVLNDDRISRVFIGCLFTVDLSVGGKYAGSQYDASRFLSREITRDKNEEHDILANNEAFWEDYIEPGVEPAPSGNIKHDLEVIKAITGPADPKLPPMNLTTDVNKQLIQEYLELDEKANVAKSELDAINAQKDKIKTDFIRQLGQTVEGQVDGDEADTYYEIKYAPASRKSTDYKTLEALFPEAYNACVSVDKESSRRFTIKAKKRKKAV